MEFISLVAADESISSFYISPETPIVVDISANKIHFIKLFRTRHFKTIAIELFNDTLHSKIGLSNNRFSNLLRF